MEKRKPDVVRGDPLNPSASAELRYYERLESLINRMADEVERDLRKLFDAEHAQEFFAMDENTASQARIVTNALMKKFNSMFATNAKAIAEQVANEANKSSSAALHSSIQKLSGGLSLGTRVLDADMQAVLSATVTENVGLIKSIAQQYLTGVQGAVMRSITTGNGLQDLVPYLQKHKGITHRRARMIAGDQTRKAFNCMNRDRMQKLGLGKFEWLHTGGTNEPRPLHVAMSGKIYSFDNLPVIDERTGERGIPGQAINCRCRMVTVLEFDD